MTDPDPASGPEVRFLSRERLVATFWELGQEGGDLLAPFVRLMPDGRIVGPADPGASLWSLRDDALVLLDDGGDVTVRFETIWRGDDGLLRLAGTFLPDPAMRRLLREIVPFHAGDRPHLPARLERRASAGRRDNLVIVRANENSLHPEWLGRDAPGERSWDLCTSWYGRAENFPPDDGAEYAVLQRDERKFQAIRSLLLSHPELLDDYAYIMLPDDDLRMTRRDIDTVFAACARWGLQIAQPALDPAGVVNYPATVQDRNWRVRFASMVEVMTPVFSRCALQACLPTFDLTVSSFGIDYTWPRILGTLPSQIGIIDEVAILHTRPTASSYDIQAAYKEGDALSGRYGRTGWFQVAIVGGHPA